MNKPKVLFDVGPLFEGHWTGIPNVIAGLSEQAFFDARIDWHFAFETVPLPRSLIEKLLSARSAMRYQSELHDAVWQGTPIDVETAQEFDALFPHVKPVRNFFRREALILHDLSPVLTPQFHSLENVQYFSSRIREDIMSCDQLFCVSEATRRDAYSYFSYPMEKSSVIRLGVDFDPCDLTLATTQLRPEYISEPYVLILGTLEPRKNATILFEFLEKHPDFAKHYKFILAGRDGWCGEKERLLGRLRDAGVSSDRIIFTGFLNDTQRAILIANSAFCVYPSRFEGFGLPILEAASLGKLTVSSNSSSMPEVAPEQCIFFDPTNVEDFSEAMYLAHQSATSTRPHGVALSDLLQNSTAHDWKSAYKVISDWLLGDKK